MTDSYLQIKKKLIGVVGTWLLGFLKDPQVILMCNKIWKARC